MKQTKFQKTVVIHQGALGDLVCTLPALNALREVSATVVGIGSGRLKLLEYAGILDKSFLADALGFHRLFLPEFVPGGNLSAVFSDADLAVSWLGRKSGAYRQNLSRLAAKVSVFSGPFPPGPGDGHACAVLARPVIEAGIPVSDLFPRLSLPSSPDEEERMPAIEMPFIAVHPGSGSRCKALPLKQLFRLMDSLSGLLPERTLALIAGDAEKSLLIELVKNLPDKLKPRTRILENLELTVLARSLCRAELFVGMDSGPTHLAASLGVKTIAVFGPTSPEIWAPPQPWVRVVRSSYPCAPCTDDRRRNCPEALCLENIDLSGIISAARNLLAGGPPAGS